MDSASGPIEGIITRSKLKKKVQATREMLDQRNTGAMIDFGVVSNEEQVRDEENSLVFCSDKSSDEEKLEMASDSRMGVKILDGIAVCLQVQAGEEESGTVVSTYELEKTSLVQGDEGVPCSEASVGLSNELITEINRFKGANPIAKVNTKDLEEANECKFGKPIAEIKCMEGVRQNDSIEENGDTLNNNMVKGPNKGNMSYARAVNKRDVGGNIFSNKSSMVLEYTPFKRGEGVQKISITPEVDAMEKWRKCLVGYFLGSRLPFHIVKNETFKLWNNGGLKKMAFTNTGFYLFDFVDEEARDKALEEGIIHIFGRVMVLKKWHLMMSFAKEACEKVPIWVNFHNLPYEYWTEKSLGRIASIIGVPLYADQATEQLSRITYARVCIEIEAKEEKVETIMVECDGKCVEVGVKYQWYPARCSECKVFGHSIDSCPAIVKATPKEAWVNKGNVRGQEKNNPKRLDVWKKVRSGNNDALVSNGRNGKDIASNAPLKLSNSFDIMLSCDDLNAKELPIGKFAVQKSCDNAGKAVVSRNRSAFSADYAVETAVSSSSSGSGLLGSDDIFGIKTCPNPWNWEKKEIKKTEKSKLKDRNGNVLCLKDIKKVKSKGEEVEGSPSNVVCEGEIALKVITNPEMDESLFDAFCSKGEVVVGTPTSKSGLSFSDYPSDWSKRRIKKAIRAVQLSGPPKTMKDPP